MIDQNLGELLDDEVTLDMEGIDCLYLNVYQPMLQTGGGVSTFFKHHRSAVVASTTLMAPMSNPYYFYIYWIRTTFVLYDQGATSHPAARSLPDLGLIDCGKTGFPSVANRLSPTGT
jgi:hypothetical protein